MDIFVFIVLTISLQDSSNVRLIGWWPYSTSNAVISNGNYTYLGSGFGIYVLNTRNPYSPQLINRTTTKGAVNGLFKKDNYLFCANGMKGLSIFDITNPADQILIGELELDGEAQDIFVKDSFAYIAFSGTNHGLWIINISEPSNPVFRGAYIYSHFWGCSGVEVRDSFAYLAANQLKILNVANPAMPQLIDSIPTLGFVATDVEIRDTIMCFSEHGPTNYMRIANIANATHPVILYNASFPQAISGLKISGTLCYISHIVNFYIYDITDPSHPYYLGGLANTGGSDVAIYNTIAYLTGGKLRVIDVAIPQTPYVMSNFYLPGSIENIFVRDTIAYLSMAWNGLWIMNISNPVSPWEIGKSFSIMARDAYVRNGIAYCVGDSGLIIVDVTNPQTPIPFANLTLPYQAWGLTLFDSICYIADGYGGLRIVNVADSINPVEIGFFPSGSHTWDVAVQPGIAYIADHSDGLKIIDISHPSSPVLLGHLPYPNYQTKIVEARSDTIYVVTNSIYSYLRIIDAHNPASPVELGALGSSQQIYDLALSNHYAYITTGEKLSVIDVSHPATPVEVGYYNLPAEGYSCSLYNNHILVGTYFAGLMLFDYYGPGIKEQKKINTSPRLILNNPVGNEVRLRYHHEFDEYIDIKIFNIVGELCYKWKQKIPPGILYKNISTANFSSGVYFLVVQSGMGRWMEKFTILK
ncbi:MAG: hypothetical protein ACUVQT_07230 [bacterium]